MEAAMAVEGAAAPSDRACRQAVITVNWPGMLNVMTPPQAQFAIHELFTAGLPPIITVGEPGLHGAGTTG